MKRLYYYLDGLIFITLLISCDDQVEPKVKFNEVYTLNSVIRCDTSYQIATVTRSYDVSGYDPMTNTQDPFIQGAKITLTYYSPNGTEVYQFRDTSIARSGDSRYSTPLHFYYLKNFQPAFNNYMAVQVKLPNGQILYSNAKAIVAPSYSIGYFKRDNPNYGIPGFLLFDWSNITNGLYNVFSLPEFHIKYKKYEDGIWKDYVKLIPLFYSKGKNPGIPIYPTVQKYTEVSFDTLTIRKAFEEISTGDPSKQNYLIDKVVFMVNLMDVNLAIYYSTFQTFKIEFSVRTTQPEFTNINSGLGIFGTMYTVKKEVPLTIMIKSLGYRTN